MKPADIYIINRENVQWLIEESGLPFNYDTVVVDELSSFKSYQAKRFRALMKVRPKVKRIMGLTGTPSSNGLMDLWAEFRLLDMGARLGRFIRQYRTNYFQPDKRNGQVIFLQTAARSGTAHLQQNCGYHHQHEVHRPCRCRSWSAANTPCSSPRKNRNATTN
jgi:SNF2 family DNA or RNA helicase